MNKLLYFAYGSNLMEARLRSRIQRVSNKGIYRLKGYKLVFNGGFGGYANIEPSEASNDLVEGVLYELNDHQVHILDLHEGYPTCYQKFFIIEKDTVIFGYWTQTPISRHFPTQSSYLDIILSGCVENKLIDTYSKVLAIKKSLRKEASYGWKPKGWKVGRKTRKV